MEAHRRLSQTSTTSPRRKQRVRSCILVLWVTFQPRECFDHGLDTQYGELIDDGITVSRVQRFDGMGDGVEPGSQGDVGWEREGEVYVVDDNFGEDFKGGLGGLQAVFCLTNDRCDLDEKEGLRR